MRIKILLLAGSVALAIAGAVLLSHLFRLERYDNPALGLIEHEFRWGHFYELRADVNRDGKADVRARYEATLTEISAHDVPVEYWEDRDFDGLFEIHAYYNDETLIRVEIDDDGDSKPEEILVGEEAAKFFLRFVPKEKDG